MKAKKNIKKKEKKVVGVNPKFDIPMYDPYTGEPNPHYEELTGEANPYVEMRKTQITENPLNMIEPVLSNRFLVKFPDEFDIKPFYIVSVNLPSIVLKRTTIFGQTIFLKKEIGEVTFELMDNSSVIDKIMKNINTNPNIGLDYELEILDPTGVVIERWKFKKSLIKIVDFSGLSYDNDQFMRIVMTIQPSDVILTA